MKLTVEQVDQSINANIYVENSYKGHELSSDSLSLVNSIPWSKWIQAWLAFPTLKVDFAQDCEIGLQLTGDLQIQQFNQQYRSIDTYTDVLAFAATESEIVLPLDITEPLYLGDIIISLETANRQAQLQKHSLVTELAWLSSHGLLHLLGWDHPNDQRLQEMLQQQSKLVDFVKIQQSG